MTNKLTILSRFALVAFWLCMAMPVVGWAQAPLDHDPIQQLIERDLRKPVSFEYIEASIFDAIEHLSEQAGVPIRFDPHNDTRDLAGNAKVTGSGDKVPLKTGLRDLLANSGLWYMVTEEGLYITDLEKTMEFQLTRTYDISELVGRPPVAGTVSPACEELVELITTTIEPVSWDEVGGPSSIVPINLQGVQMLAVQQNTHGHENIMALLARMQKQVKASPARVGVPMPIDATGQMQHGRMLAGIGEAETMEIDYQSNGCWHNEHYLLRFSGTTPRTVTVTQLLNRKREPVKEDLGTLKLTDEELRGVNRLLNYYRTGPRGRCSTTDRVTITWMSGDQEIAKESFVDDSCGIYFENQLRLSTLIRRLKPVESEAGGEATGGN